MSLRNENPKLYFQIHEWAYKHVLKPQKCNRCQEETKLEISNNSQKYMLDVADWEWICHSCHAKKDKWGNLEKAHEARRGIPSWNKGQNWSDKMKLKLSDAHKGKHHAGTFKKGQSPWTKGRKLTEEHKRKIGEANRLALKKYYATLKG